MTTLLQSVLQANTVGDLESAFNAAFLTRLDAVIRNVQLSFDLSGGSRPQLILTVDYEAGGVPMVNPWKFKLFSDQGSMATVSALFTAYEATLPLAFFSQSFSAIRPGPPNSTSTFFMGAVYNTVLADGLINWLPLGGRITNIGDSYNTSFMGTAGGMNGIAYGNGLFVAIVPTAAGTPTVWTSPDGIAWTVRRSAPAASWTAIAFGNGKFIAAAVSGAFMSSTDGITWAAYTATNLAFTPGAIMFANNVWVAVSSNSTASAFSTDGITWTTSVSQATTGLVSLAYGNGVFVGVGNATSLNIMTSANGGGSWTTRTGVGTALRGVAWSPTLGLFVAVGTNFAISSPDGITWTSRTPASTATWNNVVWDSTNAVFVAVNGSTTSLQVATSANGTSWATNSTDTAVSGWRYVAAGAGITVGVLAGSSVPANILRSANATTWTVRSANFDLTYNGIVYGAGLYVAVASTGIGNRVVTTPDGYTWTQRSSAADNAWKSITYSPSLGLFVAVSDTGTGNRVMTSPDGITWTIRVSAADNAWQSVVWGEAAGLFVAVANTGSGNRVMTSPDGITWTIRVSAADNGWTKVVYGNGIFVAIAPTGTYMLMTSPDGITWTSRWIQSTAASALGFGGGRFVLGSNNTMTGFYYWSDDGITWAVALTSGNPAISKFVYSRGRWISFGPTGGALISDDGKTWRTSALAGTFSTGAIGGGDVAMGPAGAVVVFAGSAVIKAAVYAP